MKTCGISGKRFKATKDNFYYSASASDKMHPYQKDFDNFRRTTGITVKQARKLVTLLK